MRTAMHDPALLNFRLMPDDSRPGILGRHNLGHGTVHFGSADLLLVAGLSPKHICDTAASVKRFHNGSRSLPQRGLSPFMF